MGYDAFRETMTKFEIVVFSIHGSWFPPLFLPLLPVLSAETFFYPSTFDSSIWLVLLSVLFAHHDNIFEQKISSSDSFFIALFAPS